MDTAEGIKQGEEESVNSPGDKLHTATYCSENHDDVNMNNENVESGEDGSSQGLLARQVNGGIQGTCYEPKATGCDPEGSVCEPDISDDGRNNNQVGLDAPLEHSRTDLLPNASHCHPESRHQSDLAAGLSQGVFPGVSSDPGPSVSSTDQHEPIPPPQDTVSELSNIYSTNDVNQFVSVQPVLPRDSSQDFQSSDVPTPVVSQPDQMLCPLAIQGSPDHGVDHDASNSDSHNDSDRGRGVTGDVLCDADTVQERQTPHPQSQCRESVTDLSSQTVAGHLLPEGAEDGHSSTATAGNQEWGASQNDAHVLDPCSRSAKMDVAEYAAVQHQRFNVDHVEVTSSVSHAQQSIRSREEDAKSVRDISDSVPQSTVGVSEVFRSATIASCPPQSDPDQEAGTSAGDSCVPASVHSPAKVKITAASDSCMKETCPHSNVQDPDKAVWGQGVDTCPATQFQHFADSCLQDDDSANWTPAEESQKQEPSNLAVACKSPETSSVETASAQSGGEPGVAKPTQMLTESVVSRPVVSCNSESTMTSTSSKPWKTSATSMANEEDTGSSVDPVLPADDDIQYLQSEQLSNLELPVCEDVQGKPVKVLDEGDSSDSSEIEFEDVTSTLTEDVEQRGHGWREKQEGGGENVSCSDGGSDDDDFFDACDDDQSAQREEAGPHRRSTDGGDARDPHPESESQSTRIKNTDHVRSYDSFHHQENTENTRQEQHPGASESSTSTTTTSAGSSCVRSSRIPGSGRRRRTWILEKPHVSLSLWSVLKNCIGKELSKIPMPVNFSEPLSMLQRLSEELEYSEILDRAAQCQDSCEQMAHVAAFTVSAYATTQFRNAKPFNPLLGETFEMDRTEDLGWRSFAEQVSHHPPALATHAEGTGWTLWQDFTMIIRFRGRYVQIIPMGTAHLHFSGSGHHYTWRKVTTTVHNVIVGRLWVDNEGDMDIHNHTTGDVGHLHYQAYSYFSRQPHRKVTGEVKDGQGVTRWTLTGAWNSHMEAAPILPPAAASGQEEEEGEEEEQEEEEEESASSSCYSSGSSSSAGKASRAESERSGESRVLWRVRPPPEGSEKIYHFSQLAIEMNEPEEGVAPTDSRRRPDQRQMEEGNWEEANHLKFLLEEKQRDTRRQRQAEAESAQLEGREIPEYQPAWFRKETDPITGNALHVFTGEYWKCKETQQWDRCPDIFL